MSFFARFLAFISPAAKPSIKPVSQQKAPAKDPVKQARRGLATKRARRVETNPGWAETQIFKE
jgi:hypothetical protein